MPKLILKSASYNQILLEKRGDDDSLEWSDAGKYLKVKDQAKAAERLGLAKDTLVRHLDSFRRGGGEPLEVSLTPETRPFELKLRGRLQHEAEAVTFQDANPVAAMQAAIREGSQIPEPLLTWDDADALCCTDADAHRAGDRPDPSWIAGRVRPRPAAWWVTHGRGLRLVYTAIDSFTARECAAVAALGVKALEPLMSVEIKTATRLPPGPATWQTQDADLAAVRAWFGAKEVDDEEVDQWLAERGLVRGSRYPHTHCPVEPTAPGGRDPVTVRDGGIFCHACAGRGVTSGSRTPGWFPYSRFVGSPVPSTLRNCVVRKTHWEHARLVVADSLGIGGVVAEAAYSAALVAFGHPRPLVGPVFTAGRNFVRFNHRWGTLRGETYTQDIRPILAKLPVCRYIDDAGEFKTCLETVARLQQPIDLFDHGYPDLVPVWGTRIYGHFLDNTDPSRIPVVLPSANLAAPQFESRRPRYAPGDEEAAWAVLEGPFPGIDRRVVKLLICARGAVEGGIGLPPFVFLTGPSGASKTSTIMIAAAICGDRSKTITWQRDVDRVRQGVQAAKDVGSFAAFNEMMKSARRAGTDLLDAMDFVLNLTGDSTSHRLYVGQVELGRPPVCVWTDTALPAAVAQDAQLGRRIVHAHLPRKLLWETTTKTHGIQDIINLRHAGDEYVRACNVILSSVIDEFFRSPQNFVDMAEKLGFRRLADSPEASEDVGVLREFFAEVCKAPAITGQDAERYPGRGWKCISRSGESTLSDAWSYLADSDFVTSRKCSSVDWAALLGCEGPVDFDLRSRSASKLFVRFVRRVSHTEYFVNEELNGKVELATAENGDDRPGDAERGGPDAGWVAGIPKAFDDALAKLGCIHDGVGVDLGAAGPNAH